ncbi:hypothetical protein D0962_14395 [Leptolyngbyaceae cyanobacterium CCMR0082]|uniref:Uncharacterized protein n=2 Tax=Adonisia turfae TaxID=2950184 RepID=A0A6M0S7A4_9CYAN|nr:hypothetical protein [Adonisia turfae]MDV3348535.1 hypothetical protein [Leptothoe sp. LEGE 181152]NEZ60699.1 hypothetical protein [Adonisia turfae CCMR0081]NEZ63963.1 hypothetical protein [Adonisia turfae CCMR0082]
MSLLPPYLANLSQTPAKQAVPSLIIYSGILVCGAPVLANSNDKPMILIESQAVGSFIENVDNDVQQIESNIVDGVELEDVATNNSTSSERTNLNHNQTRDTSRETVQ